MTPETTVTRANHIGLDGIAITDHNTMEGVDSARQAATDDLLIIPGEEIDTPDGQLLGLFLSEPIEPWQSPEAVITEIHDQDGVVVAPHPFDAMREGLTSIADYVDDLDAVETLNSRCIRTRYNERAQTFATEHNLPATGGSDAHFAHEVGTAFTQVRITRDSSGDTDHLAAVKESLRTDRVTPEGKTSSFLVHAGTKSVKLYNRVRQR